MKTTVVNLYKEPYDVYVGRAGKGKDGYFGNPVNAGRVCPQCSNVHEAGGDTLLCYSKILKDRIANDAEFKERVKNLHGKRLGCFCKPKRCHGDFLAAAADILADEL
jgi:hypothetical protein